jgi:hypothetical protein
VYWSTTVAVHPDDGTAKPRAWPTDVIAPPAELARVRRTAGDRPRDSAELETQDVATLADHRLLASDVIGVVSVGGRWLSGRKISSAIELGTALHVRRARERGFLGAGLRMGRGALDLDDDGARTWHVGLEARAGLEKRGFHAYAAAGPMLYRIRDAGSQGGGLRHVPAASVIAGVAQSRSCDWDRWSGPELDSSARDHGLTCILFALLPDALELRYELWRDDRVEHKVGVGLSYYFDW